MIVVHTPNDLQRAAVIHLVKEHQPSLSALPTQWPENDSASLEELIYTLWERMTEKHTSESPKEHTVFEQLPTVSVRTNDYQWPDDDALTVAELVCILRDHLPEEVIYVYRLIPAIAEEAESIPELKQKLLSPEQQAAIGVLDDAVQKVYATLLKPSGDPRIDAINEMQVGLFLMPEVFKRLARPATDTFEYIAYNPQPKSPNKKRR